jgi:hypothetical protein
MKPFLFAIAFLCASAGVGLQPGQRQFKVIVESSRDMVGWKLEFSVSAVHEQTNIFYRTRIVWQ